MDLLEVISCGPLYSLKCKTDQFVFLTACNAAPCKFHLHMSRHLVIFQLQLKGLFKNRGMLSLSALSLLGVSYGSVIVDGRRPLVDTDCKPWI